MRQKLEHVRRASHKIRLKAFSLVELLIAIAVIAILATLLLPLISGHRETSQMIVARQQQAELQTALGGWITAQSSKGGGLASARSSYSSTSDKLSLLQNYLQDATYSALQGSENRVSSKALNAVGASLSFSDWPTGGSPDVIWVNSQ